MDVGKVEEQHKNCQDCPWEQTPIQCTKNDVGQFVNGKL